MSVRLDNLAYARSLDAKDPLGSFRDHFVIDDPDLIYLDGNSLGRLPKNTLEHLHHLVDHEWGGRLIRGWNEGWFAAPERIGDKIGQLLGAHAGEVIVADSTSVNLFKLALAAVNHRPGRRKIITDNLNFPSDIYILEGVLRAADEDRELVIVDSEDGIHGPTDALLAQLDSDTALLTLTHTAFKSSFTYDMDRLTQRAHQVGALVLWDLSHSVGAVPVDLQATHADLAVGCTYKYLNAGPGAPAFLYVRKDLQQALGNPVSGWMGSDKMFDFALSYQPAVGARRFLTGTPNILSMMAIEPGVELLLAADMHKIRDKSLQLSEYLIALWEQHLQPLGFRLNSPRDSAERGPHVSLGHDEGWRIDRALIEEMNVLPDFRKPDNIRLGIPPLYTRFEDIFTAVMRMRQVVEEKIYEKYNKDDGPLVT